MRMVGSEHCLKSATALQTQSSLVLSSPSLNMDFACGSLCKPSNNINRSKHPCNSSTLMLAVLLRKFLYISKGVKLCIHGVMIQSLIMRSSCRKYNVAVIIKFWRRCSLWNFENLHEIKCKTLKYTTCYIFVLSIRQSITWIKQSLGLPIEPKSFGNMCHFVRSCLLWN